MGDKDIISKAILKNLVRDFATYLFGLPVTEVELVETEYRQRPVQDGRRFAAARIGLSL